LAESKLKALLSAIGVYIQVFIGRLKAERWGEKSTCKRVGLFVFIKTGGQIESGHLILLLPD
jgi:hypothetical protein